MLGWCLDDDKIMVGTDRKNWQEGWLQSRIEGERMVLYGGYRVKSCISVGK